MLHLCFYCDQKYSIGHKCAGQLYSLEVLNDELSEVEELDDHVMAEEGVREQIDKEEYPLISLNVWCYCLSHHEGERILQ